MSRGGGRSERVIRLDSGSFRPAEPAPTNKAGNALYSPPRWPIIRSARWESQLGASSKDRKRAGTAPIGPRPASAGAKRACGLVVSRLAQAPPGAPASIAAFGWSSPGEIHRGLSCLLRMITSLVLPMAPGASAAASRAHRNIRSDRLL
jgi:hypothetical protein